MNKLTKYLISILFTLAACVTAGSAGAQTWYNGQNICIEQSNDSTYACQCQQGFSWAIAQYTNCGMNDNTLGGCWNPISGTCNSCGFGGTTALLSTSCFGGSNGQQTGSDATGGTGISCSSNSDCQGYGYPDYPTTGGGSNFYSDIRLKRDIVLLGQTDKGIRLYSFKYLWSDQVYVGVMAQDLLENPQWQDAVITNPTGYYSVSYSKLGLAMVTLEEYQQVSAVALVK